MQKRRSKLTLPVTVLDNITYQSPRKWNRAAHRKHDINLYKSLVSLALVFIVLLLYIIVGGKSSQVKSKMQDRLNIAAYKKYFKADYDTRPLPLSKFKSLDYALANSELTVLYFAASWCRMSTPVSNSLHEAFPPDKEEITLPRQSTQLSKSTEQKTLAIVYVSSDKSEDEMDNYSRENWINVPYKSSERAGIKRHFQACSKPEVEELDMIRKFEIPTIIVIDSLTNGILTTTGQIDLEDEGAHALEHWLSLRDTVRGLENKYEER